MKILGLVPARGGSKGIPDKNIRPFRGKPLLVHAIDCARASGVIDRVRLSTDSAAYAEIGAAHGAEAHPLRPAAFAADATAMHDVIAYELRRLEEEGYRPDAVALLQPTQPLRTPEHLRQAATLLAEKEADSVVTVRPLPAHFAPAVLLEEREGYLHWLRGDVPPSRRQDLPELYYRDGTLYLFRVDSFWTHGSIYGPRCAKLVIPEAETIMIDEADDWEALMRLETKAAGGGDTGTGTGTDEGGGA